MRPIVTFTPQNKASPTFKPRTQAAAAFPLVESLLDKPIVKLNVQWIILSLYKLSWPIINIVARKSCDIIWLIWNISPPVQLIIIIKDNIQIR